ncbi:MAG: DegT/DnrJ/EryC1/StrS family aminotransferase [Bacteroidetes bacterium]|nr:DegT/DnrJ/EryC1/StrS family aminotransferase [Bacteroidota bacterium]
MTEIPFYNVDRVYQSQREEFLAIIDRVYSTGSMLMGQEIESAELSMARFCGRKHAVLVGSCTDALFFALEAVGVKPGDEVLVPAFSFIASVTPILRIGAIPVFVDIDPTHFMMDIADAERKVTSATKAIMCVHLFGQTLDIQQLEGFSEKHGIPLVEDSAQSFGSFSEGRAAGGMGLVSCVSFDPTKVIGAFGNGGLLLSDDENICNHVRKLHYHGRNKSGDYEILGYNSRMANAQAAILEFQLKSLPDKIAERNSVAAQLDKQLADIKEITTPQPRVGSTHIYHKYVIRAKSRNELMAFLKRNGVKTMIHYGKALNEHLLFQNFTHRADGLSAVHHIKQQVLSLPVYPELSAQEISHICLMIRQFYAG